MGAIVVATGFKAFDPSVIPYYGYGKYPNVYTSLEVERLINAGGPTSGKFVLRDGSTPKRVAIIHCVGSRDANYHAYCSRVCCMYSLKLAHLVREKTEAEVYNCYIDIRTPGKGFEEFYNRVQDEGVQFIRGKVADITPVAGTGTAAEGGLVMQVDDTLLGSVRKINVDMVILAVALEPQADAGDVRRTFGISCSTEGFFLERHPKLAPVNTANDGVFLAGACQGAKDIPDTVAQAAAAAAKTLALIDAGQIELEPNTAWIDEDMCSGCGTCIPLVPLQGDHPRRRAQDRRDRRGAVQGLRHVRGRLPLGRRQTEPVPRRTDQRRAGRADELCLNPLTAAAGQEFQPRIVAFLCNWCSYTASDLAGTARIKYAPNVADHPRHVQRPRRRRLPAQGLHPGGRRRDDRRLPPRRLPLHRAELQDHPPPRHAPLRAWRAWESSGDRLRLVWASAAEGQILAESIDRFVADVRGSWDRSTGRPTGRKTASAPRPWKTWSANTPRRWRCRNERREDQRQAGPLLGRLLRRLRDRRAGPERENPRRGRRLRHRPLAGGHRRQGPRRREHARRQHRRSASSTAASAPASRSTWPNCSAARPRSWWPSAPAPARAAFPGWPTLNDRRQIFDTVYHQTPSTENPDGIEPQHETPMPEGTLHLPVFYDTLRTLDQTVPVDYYLPGCPPEADRIWDAITAILAGEAAAAGLGHRRRDDRLPRVPAGSATRRR